MAPHACCQVNHTVCTRWLDAPPSSATTGLTKSHHALHIKQTHPVGRIMNSCMASALPAWLPPLMMLKEGTGRYCARSSGGGVSDGRNIRKHKQPAMNFAAAFKHLGGGAAHSVAHTSTRPSPTSHATHTHTDTQRLLMSWPTKHVKLHRCLPYQVRVARQLGNVLVQGHALLSSTSLQHTTLHMS